MIPRDVKAPTVPIPFHKAAEGRRRSSTRPTRRPRSSSIRSRRENFEVEVSDSFERDVSEDASVGAYIALVDGERLEQAREARARRCARSASTRRCGRSRIRTASPTSAVLGLTGEVDGYIYLGQQTPAFYAKQVVASLVKYGMTLLPPFFGGLMAYDGEANIAFDCPGHQGGQFYRKSPAGQLFFKHFGESIFRNDLCNADVDLGDLLIHEGPAAEAQRHAAQRVRRRQDLFRPERHQHLQQGGDERRAASAATWCSSTATTTSRCTRARWSRPARSRSSCRRRAIRSA